MASSSKLALVIHKIYGEGLEEKGKIIPVPILPTAKEAYAFKVEGEEDIMIFFIKDLVRLQTIADSPLSREEKVNLLESFWWVEVAGDNFFQIECERH